MLGLLLSICVQTLQLSILSYYECELNLQNKLPVLSNFRWVPRRQPLRCQACQPCLLWEPQPFP